MKLITATVAKPPREVSTRYGDRVVLDCLTRDGQEITVWRGAGDREVLGRYPGERVTLAIDSKNKAHLVEHASSGLTGNSEVPGLGDGNGKERITQSYTAVAAPLPQPPELQNNGSRSAEIKDYTERLAKLYSHCFRTVQNEMNRTDLPIEALKDISTSIFIQTTRKFNL